MAITRAEIRIGDNWTRITIGEAARQYPWGIATRSHRLRCGICGQYIALTRQGIRDPYFKHSSKEQDKDCEDRTFNDYDYDYSYQPASRELPLRIKINGEAGFWLELGMPAIPKEYRGQVFIHGEGSEDGPRYSLDRFKDNGITFLPIGTEPYPRYVIENTTVPQISEEYLPRYANGVDARGAVFDADTYRKIRKDAEVGVDYKYYLLSQNAYLKSGQDISITHLHGANDAYYSWHLYEVTAHKITPETTLFFQEYHVYLTNKLAALYPIWPEYIEGPCEIRYRKKDLYFYIEGRNIGVDLFPNFPIEKQYLGDRIHSLVCIACADGLQIIPKSGQRELDYIYLQRASLNLISDDREIVSVTDTKDVEINNGVFETLPTKGTLLIQTAVDGVVDISDLDGFPLQRYELSAGTKCTIKDIRLSTILSIYCGMDLVWRSAYVRASKEEKSQDASHDKDILKILQECRGDQITIPHAAGAFEGRLTNHPLIREWYVQQVRSGSISRKAMNILLSEGELR